MRGVWNKLLSRKDNMNAQVHVIEQDQKIDQIVEMGQQLGIENFDQTAVRASLNVQVEDLSVEELIELDADPNIATEEEDEDRERQEKEEIEKAKKKVADEKKKEEEDRKKAEAEAKRKAEDAAKKAKEELDKKKKEEEED